jgi:teichuronic acid biosynthesis glycosyltransferase TuaH
MKRILYLTTTDWGWAKQRPHFIAEGLTKYFDVEYVFQKRYKKKNFVNNSIHENLRISEIFRFPFDRNIVINYLNKIIFLLKLSNRLKKCDIIWITHPFTYNLVKTIIPEIRMVVYDCMDDHLEFPEIKKNEKTTKWLFEQEEDLVKRANITFVSSEYLKNKVIKRYQHIRQINVINNAVSTNLFEISKPELKNKEIERLEKLEYKKIVYIGTVSEWLDFELILKSLQKFENIIYIFFGPTHVPFPNHSRLINFGPINHNHIRDAMDIADALVMPFKRSELIFSVNPVKVYEYIFANKPIVILKYDETIKFRDYVYLYENDNEYITYMESLSQSTLTPKQVKESNQEFVLRNTWVNRIEEIVTLLQKL